VFLGLGGDPVVGGDDENGVVSLRGPRNHVLDEITVARTVDDREGVLVGLELLMGDVDRQPAFALFGEVIHHVGELEATFPLLFGFLTMLFDDVFGNATRLEQEATHQRTLPVVDVADNGQVLVGFLCHGASIETTDRATKDLDNACHTP